MTTHANNVLRLILATEFQPYELSIVKKPIIKLIQRLGLVLQNFTQYCSIFLLIIP